MPYKRIIHRPVTFVGSSSSSRKEPGSANRSVAQTVPPSSFKSKAKQSKALHCHIVLHAVPRNCEKFYKSTCDRAGKSPKFHYTARSGGSAVCGCSQLQPVTVQSLMQNGCYGGDIHVNRLRTSIVILSIGRHSLYRSRLTATGGAPGPTFPRHLS